jgi:hypothetical protein
LWQLFKDLDFFKKMAWCVFIVIINHALNSLKMFLFIIDQSILNYNSTSCWKMLISKNSTFILCQLKLCGLVFLSKLCPSPTCTLVSSYGSHFITFIANFFVNSIDLFKGECWHMVLTILSLGYGSLIKCRDFLNFIWKNMPIHVLLIKPFLLCIFHQLLNRFLFFKKIFVVCIVFFFPRTIFFLLS